MGAVGINGFGRIGRLVLRACLKQGIEVRHVNDPGQDAALMAYLFKYDSTHGRYPDNVISEENHLIIGNSCISVSQEKDPQKINWDKRHVCLVVEGSGAFTTTKGANLHIQGGARRVIITAPSSDAPTIAYGVNHSTYNSSTMSILSCASCTTNCIAPVAKVLHEKFCIVEGMVTTIHATTATQRTVDGPSKKDWRGGRGAGQNIIPSSTGAAKALSKVLPDLKGILTAIAFRVPTPNVSVIDVTCKLKNCTSYDEIKKAMKDAAESELKGILEYTEDDVVSMDINSSTASAVFDAKAGLALNDTLVKCVAWYDNEFGYAHRVVDMIKHIQRKGNLGDRGIFLRERDGFCIVTIVFRSTRAEKNKSISLFRSERTSGRHEREPLQRILLVTNLAAVPRPSVSHSHVALQLITQTLDSGECCTEQTCRYYISCRKERRNSLQVRRFMRNYCNELAWERDTGRCNWVHHGCNVTTHIYSEIDYDTFISLSNGPLARIYLYVFFMRCFSDKMFKKK